MKTPSVDTFQFMDEVVNLRTEVERLKTLLFIHQQFCNDDYPDEWREEWQAFVDQQQDRQSLIKIIEDNILEFPRNFRTRYRKWASAERRI